MDSLVVIVYRADCCGGEDVYIVSGKEKIGEVERRNEE
jgi:hypothetical protein